MIQSQGAPCPAVSSHFLECKISTTPRKTRKPKWKYQSEAGRGEILEEEKQGKRDQVKGDRGERILPMFRPSSSTDRDTEKRYSERKVRERERETEDAIGLQGWDITGHSSL